MTTQTAQAQTFRFRKYSGEAYKEIKVIVKGNQATIFSSERGSIYTTKDKARAMIKTKVAQGYKHYTGKVGVMVG